MSLIFIFLDGIGLAPAGPDNPLASAPTPALRGLLGGPLTLEQVDENRKERKAREVPDSARAVFAPFAVQAGWQIQVLFKPIDATLGVDGLPQSGTGHTALLAGVNAAALHGRHQPHFPPTALRPLLAARSIFRRTADRGRRATFANAFGPGYWDALAARRIRKSASVIAAEGAGLTFRDGNDLRAGRAVSWDVTNAAMRLREPQIPTPLVQPAQAGANLARLAHDHALVFYESFLPDLAGHGRLASDDRPPTPDDRPPTTDNQPPTTDDRPSIGGHEQPGPRSSVVGRLSSVEQQIHAALALLDGLIGGVLASMRPEDTLLITSDHGNVESLAAPAHTRNPVPLLVVGSAAVAFAAVESIIQIADAIERVVDSCGPAVLVD